MKQETNKSATFQEQLASLTLQVATVNDEELEKMWQNSATSIANYAQRSWHCSPEDEEKFHTLAVHYQKQQQIVQNEITRRGK